MSAYHYYRNHDSKEGWGVRGPGLDMPVPDKGLALAIAKFLNEEADAGAALKRLWLNYQSGLG